MKSPQLSIGFHSLISAYKKLQSTLMSQVNALASQISSATPGSFLLVQFSMQQITQIGESISNLISQVNQVINHAVQMQNK